MKQHAWLIWRLAWMRRDCIPYGGKIEGWTRIAGLLFWRSGYSREFEIRCAFRQGWVQGNQWPRELDMDRVICVSDQHADDYTRTVIGARR